MKIKADREILLSRLQKVVKFIPGKSIIPIQDMFLFSVQGNTMKVVATNSQIQATMTNIPVDCGEIGSFCIPAKLLVSTLSLIREPEVVLNTKVVPDSKTGINKVQIELKSGRSKYKLSGEDADNFPIIPRPDCPNEITMDGASLKNNIKTVSGFVDDGNQLAALQGINIRELDNKIIISGASSHYFCRATLNPRSINKWDGLVITKSCAKAICDSVEDKDVVDIFHDGNKLVMECGPLSFVSTIIDGKYPDTDNFYNKKPSTKAVLNNLEIQDALKRLKLYTGDESSKIHMEIKDTVMEMQASDEFNNHSGIEVVGVKADKPISLFFNAKMFIDIISEIEESEVEMSYSESDQPLYIDSVVMEGVKAEREYLLAVMKF